MDASSESFSEVTVSRTVFSIRKSFQRLAWCLVLLTLAGGMSGSCYGDEVAAKAAQSFPIPLSDYASGGGGIWDALRSRARQEPFNVAATTIFILAILHTFLAPFFQKLAHHFEHEHRLLIEKEGRTAEAKPHIDSKDDVSFKAQIFHFLGEVEAIFGIWVIPLLIAIAMFKGWPTAKSYLTTGLDFTEPLFVVVIMAIAASRPVLMFAERILSFFARFGGHSAAAWWLSILTVAPMLGSFITEPAAMTIGALLLAKKFYDRKPSSKLAYATLGLLFVNISVGGTLTHFAAPPVLMVASKWGWGMGEMVTQFGWKAFTGVVIANALYFAFFRAELQRLAEPHPPGGDALPTWENRDDPIPFSVTAVHIAFLVWTVMNSHYRVLFVGGFLFFLAFTEATEHHQNEIRLRQPLLVGFFLAGLVVHGGLQAWWLEPVLSSLGKVPLLLGATILTAFNDNAAITYLASLVPGFTPALKYAVVAGAVAGGGLTVIANAPNPAGQTILWKYFPDGVSPLKLFLGALLPTVIVTACFLIFS
jgi:hypothetical protein